MTLDQVVETVCEAEIKFVCVERIDEYSQVQSEVRESSRIFCTILSNSQKDESYPATLYDFLCNRHLGNCQETIRLIRGQIVETFNSKTTQQDTDMDWI